MYGAFPCDRKYYFLLDTRSNIYLYSFDQKTSDFVTHEVTTYNNYSPSNPVIFDTGSDIWIPGTGEFSSVVLPYDLSSEQTISAFCPKLYIDGKYYTDSYYRTELNSTDYNNMNTYITNIQYTQVLNKTDGTYYLCNNKLYKRGAYFPTVNNYETTGDQPTYYYIKAK